MEKDYIFVDIFWVDESILLEETRNMSQCMSIPVALTPGLWAAL